MFFSLILRQHSSCSRAKRTIGDTSTLWCLTGMPEIFFLNEMQVPVICRALKAPACERAKGFVHLLSDLNPPAIS